VATGTGIAAQAVLAFVGRSGSVIGGDVSPNMLDVARNRLANLPVPLEHFDARNLPFADGSFDAVICSLGRKANMPRIDELSDGEVMKLQSEYVDSLPICPVCTLEEVRHLLLELVAGYAASDEVKSALAPVLSAVTDALVTDRKMAEQGGGSAHLGGDEDNDDDGAQ
jgi:SAM-dependent methyltransferase